MSLLLALLVVGCSDATAAMQLNDGTALHLDWAFIGGQQQRIDRLVLAEDGSARRNHLGNLFTLADMTAEERGQLDSLRDRYAPIAKQHDTGPSVEHPSAWRLRFVGHGHVDGTEQVRAFAETVLNRLAHPSQLHQSDVAVAARVDRRQPDGRAQLLVERVLADTTGLSASESLRAGDRVAVRLVDARAGAGGATVVIALSALRRLDSDEPGWRAEHAAYLKLKVEAAAELLGR